MSKDQFVEYVMGKGIPKKMAAKLWENKPPSILEKHITPARIDFVLGEIDEFPSYTPEEEAEHYTKSDLPLAYN